MYEFLIYSVIDQERKAEVEVMLETYMTNKSKRNTSKRAKNNHRTKKPSRNPNPKNHRE